MSSQTTLTPPPEPSQNPLEASSDNIQQDMPTKSSPQVGKLDDMKFFSYYYLMFEVSNGRFD